MGEAYAFSPLAAGDIPLLREWLGEPHVRRIWGDPDAEARLLHVILDEADTDAYVVTYRGAPLGYAQAWQTAAVGAYPDQPCGTRAVDVFVGPPAMLGRGHGAGLIAAFAERLLRDGAPRIISDPVPANTIALRAYRRAGFHALGERTTPDGPVVLMAKDPGQRKDD